MTVAEAYRAALGEHVIEFRIDASDRTGVPVHAAVVLDADGKMVTSGIGYGADAEAARLSALGEALEGVGVAACLPGLPLRYGSYAELRDAGALDPVALIVDAGTTDARTRSLAWVAAERAGDGAAGLVPLEWVVEAPGELPDGYEPLITPITNGLGAGDTHERAFLHGLLELLQRDGNSVAHRAMDRGVAVDDAGAADWLRELGIDVQVKVAELDRGIAVVHAVGAEPGGGAPEPLGVTACGEACDPDPQRAITKALLEFCSSRVRKPFSHGTLEQLAGFVPDEYLEVVRAWTAPHDEPRALEATRAWLALSDAELGGVIADPVLAVRDRVGIDTLPVLERSPEIGVRLQAVLDLLAQEGLEAWSIDLSPPGSDVHVVRAIVPGLEVETMSYRRIGARNIERLLRRGVTWAGFGDPPARTLHVPLPDGRPAWLDPAGLDAALGPFYALYREPTRHSIALLAAAR